MTNFFIIQRNRNDLSLKLPFSKFFNKSIRSYYLFILRYDLGFFSSQDIKRSHEFMNLINLKVIRNLSYYKNLWNDN